MSQQASEHSSFQLRFQSLFDAARALAFPCNAHGHVDMDALSLQALNNYLYARAFVGREFFTPQVLHQGELDTVEMGVP